MLTREDKEKTARASDDSDLLETLVTLTTLGAHDYFACDRPDRRDITERFRVTRNEILKRMGAANATEHNSN